MKKLLKVITITISALVGIILTLSLIGYLIAPYDDDSFNDDFDFDY